MSECNTTVPSRWFEKLLARFVLPYDPATTAKAFFCLKLALVINVSTTHYTAAQEPQKIAFLVGINQYDKTGFAPLSYCEKDILALQDVFQRQGFRCSTLLGSGKGELRATLANIRKQFEEFHSQLAQLNRTDIVLVVLAGHGIQRSVTDAQERLTEVPFYCPSDALFDQPDSWLSLNEVLERLGQRNGSENNLVIVDACRNNPQSRGIDGSNVRQLPVNLGILFSSSAGREAFESSQLEHGLFSYYLLEGLQGAASDADGEVTWDNLVSHVKKRVEDAAPGLTGGRQQRPNAVTNLVGRSPVLARVAKNSDVKSIAVMPKSEPTQSIKADFTSNHEGAGALLMKEPDFLSFLANSTGRGADDKAIGRLINGTELADLKERRSDSVPWVKVRVLDGDFKDQEGWLMQRDLRKK